MSSESSKLLELFRWPEGAEVKTFKAACHCRRFTYEVSHPALDVKKPLSCNCTYCTKTGSLYIYGPETILRFDEDSTDRNELSKFRSKSRPSYHHFCPGCGCYLFWQTKDRVGVNVRMFDGIEVDKLSFNTIDGRAV